MLKSQTLLIEPGLAERHYWRDIWRYRELFLVLAWRDISVRYKQTIIGVSWALVQPIVTMIVFTLIFGKIAKLPSSDRVPYALLVFCGLLPWQFFSSSLSSASNSLIANSNLIGKIYFPRLIVPAAGVMVAFVDFIFSFVILIFLMVRYHYLPGWQILFLPFFVGMAFLSSLGPGLWLAALNVKYRDFRYIVPFFVQFGLYISPVGFSSSVIPSSWKLLYSLNPVVGVIDGFRWCILGDEAPIFIPGFIMSLCIVGFFLWLGIRQFRKMEKSFADLM